MRILCLDAALAATGAAVVAGGAVLAEAEAPGGQGQAAAVAVLAERVLGEAGLDPRALDAVAVTVGPGGFTGLRAALALAHGLADGAGIGLVAVSTAEALAAAAPGGGTVAVLIDSRRGHRFVQVFDVAEGLPAARGPARAVAAAGLAASLPPGALTVGDAPEAAVKALPRARDLAALAEARRAGRLPPLAAVPLYLDPPAARPVAPPRPPPLP